MFRSLLLLVCAFAALAQTQLSTVSGVVLNSVTRLPMEGVHVSMQPGSASTDSQGRFRIPEVGPGRQWISLFDKLSGGSGGAFVLVKAGEELSGVEVLLKPGGTITGKVVDENGKPLAGVPVLLLERCFDGGKLVYAPRLTVVTDKDGVYRMTPVPPEEGFLILARRSLDAADSTGDVAPTPASGRGSPWPPITPMSDSHRRRKRSGSRRANSGRRSISVWLQLSPTAWKAGWKDHQAWRRLRSTLARC